MEFSERDSFLCNVEIERLRSKGAIEAVEPSEDQFLSSLLMDKTSGGKCFILNLKELNTYCRGQGEILVWNVTLVRNGKGEAWNKIVTRSLIKLFII